MFTDLSFELSPVWLLPFLIGGIAAVWVLYAKDSLLSKPKRWLLAILRFFTLSIISFLLLSPILKVDKLVKDKPLLLWLEDRSASLVANSDSILVKEIFSNSVPELLSKMEDRFEVKKVQFGDGLSDLDASFEGKASNLSDAISEMKQRYYGENIGAMVLISDGIYNRGINPIYVSKNNGFPIFTVAFGDTSVRKDLFIESLTHNELTYLNNSFPLEIHIKARKLIGQRALLQIKNSNSKIISTQEIEINGNDFYQKEEVYIQPDSVGVQKYNVSLSKIEGEANSQNNSQSFNIEVVDNRKNILLLGSAPHPDLGALNSALSHFEQYEVNLEIGGLATLKDSAIDLFILHDPEKGVLDAMKNSNKPFFVIYGSNTDQAAFGKLVGVKLPRRNFDLVQAHVNSAFNFFTLNETWPEFVSNLPPLNSPFGKAKINVPIQTLLYKKVSRVKTQEPLWFFKDEDGRRSSYLLGTGLWQWRMYDYRKHSNFVLFDGLIAQVLQYLNAKKTDQRFSVDIEAVFEENSKVKVEARLYNQSLELTNKPEVKLAVKAEDGSILEYTMSKTAYAYNLKLSGLPPGNYSWKGNCEFDGELFKRSGNFSIEKSNLEQRDLVARHSLLRQIANESKGGFFEKDDFAQLEIKLDAMDSAKSIQRTETNFNSLINKQWIFFTLLLLLAAEWGLRKFFGKY